MILLELVLVLLGIYLSAYVGYELLLFAANAVIPEPAAFEPSTLRRFAVLIPAHDEELHLPRLLTSLHSQVYAKDRYRVVVVADNCHDGTAAIARSAAVDVLERTDTERKGKGHAIGWALDLIGLDAFDAVVIVDGDSQVTPELLRQLNLQMERGDRVIQCYNGVANPGQTWFTRLMDISRTVSNEIVHPAKRKLGLSSHLMGNGMCFDVAILKLHGWNAFSVGEDWEYYAKLILSGVDVGYSRLARVFHQESVNLRQASSQRLRWSSGRFEVLQRYALRLFVQGIRRRDVRYVDAALPLLFPNPSLGINLTLLGVAAAGVIWIVGGTFLLVWFSALTAMQLAMFLIGVWHTQNRLANALTLLCAPAFLAWKMSIDLLSILGAGRKEWKRTERRLS
jgi:cellulose synthase/poly-beta-1,6-N-acetylglucosamine synthase-like glycosyltransferase